MTRHRLLAALALSAFLCAAALAVADVVQIGSPWTVKSDPDAFVQADEAPEPPPPVGDENHVPAAPPADEARSCTGDASCVKPKRRAQRADDRHRSRADERAAESEPREDDGDRAHSDETPAALFCADAENCAGRLVGTLEGVRELGEDGLVEPLGELRDHDQDVLVGTAEDLLQLDEEALAELACEEEEGGEEEKGEEEEGEECDLETLLDALLDCESLEACEPHDLDETAPEYVAGDAPETDDSAVPVEPFDVLVP